MDAMNHLAIKNVENDIQDSYHKEWDDLKMDPLFQPLRIV